MNLCSCDKLLFFSKRPRFIITRIVLIRLIMFLQRFGVSSLRHIFINLYICFCITRNKLIFWFKGDLSYIFFKFFSLFGIATTEQNIVMCLMGDILRELICLITTSTNS
jgi:hypothetical protein